ncbi:MAG: FlgD immunoglobulin-like domain containing protein, partial [Candidatus Cloacimonadaceae bacterium]|nr:FlgD immunoglobulin-like domain containing protein [Candidatus Cloacimonadaceae bacterium]
QQQVRDNMYSVSSSSTGLMGYYKFDQESGTTVNDATTNGRNATYNPSAAWATGGIVPEFYYRSKQSGNWTSPATWEASPNGSTWHNGVVYPIVSSEVTISTGHDVSLTGSATCRNLTVTGGSLGIGSNVLRVDQTLAYTGGSISGNPAVNGYTSNLNHLGIAENSQTISNFSVSTALADPIASPTRIRRTWSLGGAQSGTKAFTFSWGVGEDYGYPWSATDMPFIYANGTKITDGHTWNEANPRQVTINYSLGAKGTVSFGIGGGEDQTLPVELSSFTATFTATNLVTLHWTTQSETGALGYYLFRGTNDQVVSAEMISPLIPANNTSQQQTYSFNDTEIPVSGMYYYWLQSVDLNGSFEFHGPVSVLVNLEGNSGVPEIPISTMLRSVFPNPFSELSYIEYGVAKAANVIIKIYNTKGQLVRSFEEGSKNPNTYKITWDGKDNNGVNCTSGIYLIHMQAGNIQSSMKTMLLK